MDLNCADIEHLVVADTHGSIDIRILEQIFPFFDGFIIHLSENQSSNFEIQEILSKIFQNVSANKKKTILIIKHHEHPIFDFAAKLLNQYDYENLEIL